MAYRKGHFFIKSSKFFAASYKYPSNLLILRPMACTESFLPIGWRTFIWWKSPPNYCVIRYPQPLGRHQTALQKMYSSRIFWGSVWRKRQPVCLRRRIIGGNFGWRVSELWTLIKNSRSKFKKSKTYSVWCPNLGLSRGAIRMQI
jgi:hypothetical protein